MADGAFGTYYAKKYDTGSLPELANLQASDRVLAIHKEYIEADYLELYGQEHKEIVAFIKQLKTDMNNIVSKSDAISFLITSKSYIPESDIDEIVPNIKENICEY